MLELLDLLPHCGAVILPCLPSDIPLSAEITILQHVRLWQDTKRAVKHSLIPPNTKFSPNSRLAPLQRRAMIHTAATHTLTRQNRQPQEHGCSEFPALLTKAAAYKSLEKNSR